MRIINIFIIAALSLACKNTHQESKPGNTPKLEVASGKAAVGKVEELLKVELKKSGITSFSNFDVLNNVLYLNSANLLLSFNVKTKRRAELKPLNDLKNSGLNFDYVFNFKSNKEGFTVTNINSVYSYNATVNNSTLEYSQERLYYSTFVSHYLFLCNYNSVKVLDENYKAVDSLDFNFIDNFFVKSSDGFCYFEDFDSPLYEFKINSNKIKVITRRSLASIDVNNDNSDFFVSYIDAKYIVGFYYSDRSNLHFIDRNDYKVKRKIFLAQDLTPSADALAMEEGNPNMKVSLIDGFYYVTVLSAKKDLVLYRVKI